MKKAFKGAYIVRTRKLALPIFKQMTVYTVDFFFYSFKFATIYILLTILHTIYLPILQERYHGVQEVMTTPWPLT